MLFLYFLKISPNIRNRCYHVMAFDMTARPSKILSLRISDIKFKINNDGIQYVVESRRKDLVLELFHVQIIFYYLL